MRTTIVRGRQVICRITGRDSADPLNLDDGELEIVIRRLSEEPLG